MQVDKVACGLERVRGSIQGARAVGQCAIFDVLHPYLEALTRLQVLYANNSVVTALLFKLAADLVDTQIGCLSADKAQVRLLTVLKSGVLWVATSLKNINQLWS